MCRMVAQGSLGPLGLPEQFERSLGVRVGERHPRDRFGGGSQHSAPTRYLRIHFGAIFALMLGAKLRLLSQRSPSQDEKA